MKGGEEWGGMVEGKRGWRKGGGEKGERGKEELKKERKEMKVEVRLTILKFKKCWLLKDTKVTINI